MATPSEFLGYRSFHHKEPSAAKAATKNSEYLPQRHKGRKEIKLLNLAILASWREQIPVVIATGHWKFAQAAKIFKHSNAKDAKIYYVNFAFSAVNLNFFNKRLLTFQLIFESVSAKRVRCISRRVFAKA
jgi:hypothetical protein